MRTVWIELDVEDSVYVRRCSFCILFLSGCAAGSLVCEWETDEERDMDLIERVLEEVEDGET